MEHQVSQQPLFGRCGSLGTVCRRSGSDRLLQVSPWTVAWSATSVALAGPRRAFPSQCAEHRGRSRYVADALARGASAALVCKPQDVAIAQFTTPDTYTGLWQLGAAARARLPGPVIAVTGSSGKTTANLSAALEVRSARQFQQSHWCAAFARQRLAAGPGRYSWHQLSR